MKVSFLFLLVILLVICLISGCRIISKLFSTKWKLWDSFFLFPSLFWPFIRQEVVMFYSFIVIIIPTHWLCLWTRFHAWTWITTAQKVFIKQGWYVGVVLISLMKKCCDSMWVRTKGSKFRPPSFNSTCALSSCWYSSAGFISQRPTQSRDV